MDAEEDGMAHLHSHGDDLESCFWVALWSVIFNKCHKKALSPRENRIMNYLAKGSKDDAAWKVRNLSLKDRSDIMKCFHPVLRDWFGKVEAASKMWLEVLDNAPVDAGEKYYLPRFHLSALRGVVNILEVMWRHWNDEIGWESWTPPSPPVAPY